MKSKSSKGRTEAKTILLVGGLLLAFLVVVFLMNSKTGLISSFFAKSAGIFTYLGDCTKNIATCLLV